MKEPKGGNAKARCVLRPVTKGNDQGAHRSRRPHIPHIAGRISALVLASGYEAAW
jgi:hypothetical protein